MLAHVVSELNKSVGVAPLVVVPGDDLHEAGVKLDTSTGVEDGGTGVGDEVAGDNLVFGVAEDSLHLVLGSMLHLLADLVVRGILGQLDGQVNDGDIGGGHAESHTSQLAVKLGDNLADSLGSASGGGDNVGTGGTTGSPVLATLGGTVNGKLIDSDGVNGCHKTFGDAPVVIEDLGDGSKAVGGAGSVGHDGHVAVVLLVVDTHHEHGRVVLGGAGNDCLLGTTLDVSVALCLVNEDTGGLTDVVSAGLTPWDCGGILLGEDVDKVSIDLDATFGLLDGSVEAS